MCYFAFVLESMSIVLWCGGQLLNVTLKLLERQVFSVARLCPVQTFLSLCHRGRVAELSILYKVISLSVQRASICFY